ncbi:MAG: site-specific integrase, partial [Bryobacteraceae bacterium]|nr:site-specific integrase [Bryobacteraceae bacterium]
RENGKKMAIFKPKYRDKNGKLVESKVLWFEFIYGGKRIRESAKTTRRTIATEAEKRRKLELERAYAGLPVEAAAMRISTVLDCTKEYRKAYDHGHREESKLWVAGRLAKVEAALGNVLLPSLTEARVREYMTTRAAEGAGGRTINMEVSMLARAIGKKWSILWPKVKHNEEPKDTGRALSAEEEARLLKAVDEARSPVLAAFVKTLLLTGMRCGELTGMTFGQVDLVNRVMTVGKAKTEAGTGRQIPMNQELMDVMKDHAKWFTKRFGETKPEYYLFPAGERWPNDPTRPTTSFKSAWQNLRTEANVHCRLHDLRHNAISHLAESGASDSTIMALAGHLSRSMMERYSHIRMNAKRQAVESLSLKPKVEPTPQRSPQRKGHPRGVAAEKVL